MNTVNQKIIDAVIEKANKICPDSLALIGVYGSVATGDEYEKSDLDLLILIEDNLGWSLGTGFILEDSKIGYDIYCTNWDRLRYDSECHHAHLSKLMDSDIVYIKKQEAYEALCKLREKTKKFLESEERFAQVNELIEKAKLAYANANLHEDIGQVRLDTFGVVYYLTDAVMLFNGKYYKCGTKRMFEELEKISLDETFIAYIKEIAKTNDVSKLRSLSKSMILYVEDYVKQEKEKKEPSEDLKGTYEELYSNWRNKVEEAAKNKDTFSSFANMCNMNYMLADISNDFNIGPFDVMEEFDSDCLDNNVKLYDAYLDKYENVYRKAGITVKRFSNVDEFVCDYLGK